MTTHKITKAPGGISVHIVSDTEVHVTVPTPAERHWIQNPTIGETIEVATKADFSDAWTGEVIDSSGNGIQVRGVRSGWFYPRDKFGAGFYTRRPVDTRPEWVKALKPGDRYEIDCHDGTWTGRTLKEANHRSLYSYEGGWLDFADCRPLPPVDRRTLPLTYANAQVGDVIEVKGKTAFKWFTTTVREPRDCADSRIVRDGGLCISSDTECNPANCCIFPAHYEIRWPQSDAAPAFDHAAWAKELKPGDEIETSTGRGHWSRRQVQSIDDRFVRFTDGGYNEYRDCRPIQGAKVEPDLAVDDLRDALAECRAALADRDVEWQRMSDLVGERDATIAAKDAEIAKLNGDVERINDSRCALSRDFTEATKTIAELRAVVASESKVTLNLNAEVTSLRAQLETERGKVADLRNTIDTEKHFAISIVYTETRAALHARREETLAEAAARVASERDAAIHEAQEREKEIKALKSESRLVLPASFLATNPLPWQSRDCGVIRSATNGIVGQINGRDVCDRVDTDVASLIVDAANRGAK
jgi:hypothetical protein